MNERFFADVSAWLTQAGLAGTPENDIFCVFCDRCVAAGISLGRAHAFIDTLHPVYEGTLYRWGYSPDESGVVEYGRTTLGQRDGAGSAALDQQATNIWRHSAYFDMLQTGASLLRRRLNAGTKDEFSLLPDWFAAGMTDYLAIVSRFTAEGTIGEMDAVYSSWGTKAREGFSAEQIAALERIVPYLALAIKTVSLARMTGTLMQTYLGRDAGQRVLSGKIVRGIAERIDAVVWFSDLRGFTRITDGTLAIFTAEDRAHACSAALSAAIAAREGIAELNRRRAAESKPVTEMYLGLHVGEVFYGNIGSRERLDFTVLGPAVNEASRIAAM